MKNSFLSAFIVLFAISCEKKYSETVNTSTTPPDSVIVPKNEPRESSTLQTCYMTNTGKDSVFVKLDDNLGTITGKMYYKNFEKDSSIGDVIGSKSGDTLKLNYTFQSEGTTSEREIYFLQKDGGLVEGIGDHKEEGNTSLYADYKKIKYETVHPLKSSDCKDLEKKFWYC